MSLERLEPQALDPFETLHLILVLLFSFLKEPPQIVSTSGHTKSGLFLGRKTSLFHQAADAQRMSALLFLPPLLSPLPLPPPKSALSWALFARESPRMVLPTQSRARS